MKISEVEKILNIPKATIRFYEKEGLLTPQRNENTYREYTDTDIETLKKIVVLRKIGISVEDIKQMQNEKLLLQEALSKNIVNLHTQMAELEGAIKVCDLMQKKEENFASLDENYYWDMILDEEEKGQTFIEIAKDYLLFEKEVLGKMTGTSNKKFSTIAVRLMIWVVFCGVIAMKTGGTFSAETKRIALRLLIISLGVVPVFILRNNVTAKATYIKWLKRIPLIILVVLLVIIVILRFFPLV